MAVHKEQVFPLPSATVPMFSSVYTLGAQLLHTSFSKHGTQVKICSTKMRLETLPKFDCRGVLAFYRSLFKIWSLFKPQWMMEPLMFLCWLMEEPIVCGARLDESGDEIRVLNICCTAVDLYSWKHIIINSCPDFKDVEAVSAFLKVKSARYFKRFLDKLHGALNVQERILLDEYNKKCISRLWRFLSRYKYCTCCYFI